MYILRKNVNIYVDDFVAYAFSTTATVYNLLTIAVIFSIFLFQINFNTYPMDGQVCLEFDVDDPLFDCKLIHKMVNIENFKLVLNLVLPTINRYKKGPAKTQDIQQN